MGKQEQDEKEPSSFSTLEFPFLPLPAASVHSPDHPSGNSTPPLQTLASVPFKWEEQPGKPRPCTDIIAVPGPARILEPPPCRMDPNKNRMSKISSPTNVLDGPYTVARPKFSSFRFFRESFDSTSSGSPHSSENVLMLGDKSGGGQRKRGFFGRGLRLKSGKKEVIDEGSFGFSSSSSFTSGCDGADERFIMDGKTKRNGSFSSPSQPTSPRLCATTIYERLKHAVPWKSTRKSKKDGLAWSICDV